MSLFKEVGEVEKTRDREVQKVKELAREKSVLDDEIKELDKTKGVLKSEISEVVSSTLETIRNTGQDATLQIQQQVTDIRKQLDDLFVDILKAGESIGQMHHMVKKGEESGKSLEKFLAEIRNR